VISAATHIARLVRAAYVFAREGVFGVVDPSLVPPPGQLALRLARLIERPGAKSGPRLSRALTRLGPAYLKLGQFLATRPDVVGVAMARDLESLQDRLPPFLQGEAEAVIAASLERPVAQAFASLGPPVAAASIAQVHRGEVERDGARHPVAVKVLRPNVAARFRRDLSDFFFVAHNAEAHSAEARRLRLIEVINTMSPRSGRPVRDGGEHPRRSGFPRACRRLGPHYPQRADDGVDRRHRAERPRAPRAIACRPA
jgi:ubiquinone biosynthesis protein